MEHGIKTTGAVSHDRHRYRHSHQYSVRFADLDLYRHVNNKAFITWVEDSRVRYLHAAAGFNRGFEGPQGMMVVHSAMDYLQQVYPFEEVTVSSRCAHIGTKSITLHHLITRDETVVAAGVTVFVAVDMKTGQSRENDAAMVQQIRAYEAENRLD
jgi:acyl-CoA thioester hydrolase